MISTTPDYWVTSREHQALTVTTNGVPVADFQVAVVKHPSTFTDADWQASTVYAGKRGVWIDTLPAGTYRIWARAGDGAPNERAIVFCGYINVRSH